MKTTKSMTLALAAMLALGASAFADQSSGQKAKTTKISSSQKTEKTTAKTWDNEPMPLRVLGYPFVMLGRAGGSIMHSPKIASETLSGKRDLVSKRGVMTERDAKKGTPKVSSAPKQSVANTRG
jgi:hypothetical protein